MKKSELKSIIKEAMMEILPELMEIMADNLNESYVSQSVIQKPDLTFVRNKHIQQQIGYSNMPTTPKNPKSIIDGEQFASGKNIMEWFSKQNSGKSISDFTHTSDQMEDYVSKKFGV